MDQSKRSVILDSLSRSKTKHVKVILTPLRKPLAKLGRHPYIEALSMILLKLSRADGELCDIIHEDSLKAHQSAKIPLRPPGAIPGGNGGAKSFKNIQK